MSKTKQPRTRIAFEFARHTEQFQSPDLDRVRAFFRLVPVLNLDVPWTVENYNNAIIRIINQITIRHGSCKIIMMYDPQLAHDELHILTCQLSSYLADGQIDVIDWAWAVSRISESLQHDSSQTTLGDV